jgi:hypothetical protein
MLSPLTLVHQDVAKGAGKEVVLGDQRIEDLFQQIGVAWKEVQVMVGGMEKSPFFIGRSQFFIGKSHFFSWENHNFSWEHSPFFMGKSRCFMGKLTINGHFPP